MNWDWKSIEWVFSGVGVTIVTALFIWFRGVRGKGNDLNMPPTMTNSFVINQNNHIETDEIKNLPKTDASTTLATDRPKSAVSILFIDDDTKFKVVNILKTNGWTNTKIVKDVISFEQPDVASADIFFVDIQGVGKALQFKDEGLGLVVALKKHYPLKKIVIYSAENGLNAFHNAFKCADDRISKDADPYEFLQVVEQLSK